MYRRLGYCNSVYVHMLDVVHTPVCKVTFCIALYDEQLKSKALMYGTC